MRVSVRFTLPNGTAWKNVNTRPRRDSSREIEQLLRRVSDDGFLETLAQTDESAAPGVATLAHELLNRRLYKRLARAQGAFAAQDLHAEFGDHATRRALEREAARYARITPEWRLILWLPPAEMRLKLAEMLVDHGQGIAKFVDYSQQGSEIYESHKALWTVSVYGHTRLSEQQRRAALARLAELMGVCWDRYLAWFGPEPDEWTIRMAAMEAFGVDGLTGEVEAFLKELDPEQLQTRTGGKVDYLGRRNELRALATKQGFKPPPPEDSS